MLRSRLDDRHGRGSHDIRPYVELGRRHGVRIIAGVGATWTWHPNALVPSLKRAQGLLAAGPDGIESYETELLARSSQNRWVMPMFGNAARIEQTLSQTNLEACWPVRSTTACYGHDNHSLGRTAWDVYEAVAAEALSAGAWYYGTVRPEDVKAVLDAAVHAGAYTVATR